MTLLRRRSLLSLSVVTPRAANPKQQRPVMVWIHGGMGHVGAGSDHDTRRLAQVGDVVVVSFNYRLGMLGNLSHPGLERSGYFVLEDPQAALRWGRDNIAAFGGDPGNVTIFGESAGSTNVCKNIPLSAGLFHRAIIQSGPCTLSWPENGIFPGTPASGPSRSQEETEAGGLLDAKALGCTDADPARTARRARRGRRSSWTACGPARRSSPRGCLPRTCPSTSPLHPGAAGPLRFDDSLWGELRADRQPPSRRCARVAAVRALQTLYTVARAGRRRHPERRLRGRSPLRLLAGASL